MKGKLALCRTSFKKCICTPYKIENIMVIAYFKALSKLAFQENHKKISGKGLLELQYAPVFFINSVFCQLQLLYSIIDSAMIMNNELRWIKKLAMDYFKICKICLEKLRKITRHLNQNRQSSGYDSNRRPDYEAGVLTTAP
jgi:hypothetical protein